MNKLDKQGILIGKNPMAVAAAILYLSCIITGEQRSQSEIAVAAQVSQVAVGYT